MCDANYITIWRVVYGVLLFVHLRQLKMAYLQLPGTGACRQLFQQCGREVGQSGWRPVWLD